MKDFIYWPKGARWPWYPELRGQGKYRCTDAKDPQSIEMIFTVVGDVKEGKIGFIPWVKYQWMKVMERIIDKRIFHTS